MKSEPFITRRDLAERIGLSDIGVKYHLDRLRKMKCIRHAGSTKRGYWEVIGNGKMERGE
jgi:ATP-dependent DNA helicase RecG